MSKIGKNLKKIRVEQGLTEDLKGDHNKNNVKPAVQNFRQSCEGIKNIE